MRGLSCGEWVFGAGARIIEQVSKFDMVVRVSKVSCQEDRASPVETLQVLLYLCGFLHPPHFWALADTFDLLDPGRFWS